MNFGATILDAEGLRLTADEKALFRDSQPFGFILFARNIDTPDQIRALCDDFRDAVGRDCLITIDQEGAACSACERHLHANGSPHWIMCVPLAKTPRAQCICGSA